MKKLKINRVSKKFKTAKGETVEALKNLNLEIRDKEFVAFVGPSGCGKSTLIRLIAGLIKPTRGEIHLEDRKIIEPSKNIGVVFQKYSLFPWLNVRKNIEFGLVDIDKKEKEALVNHYLKLIGLQEFENAYPGELSGGMQQRVAIARTMISNPKILLMDEPFGSLDAQTKSLMQEFLLDVCGKENKTVFFVTHDIEEAILLADTVYVSTIRPGRIKEKIDINLTRSRGSEIKSSKEFIELSKKLRGLIREESLKVM